LAEPFGTLDLAKVIDRSLLLAQQMAYCLREMRAVVPIGKRGNAILYSRAVI